MNQKLLKFIIPVAMLLPVMLFVVIFGQRGRSAIPAELTTVIEKTTNGVYKLEALESEISDAGGSEQAYLAGKVFNDPSIYGTFTWVRYKGYLPGGKAGVPSTAEVAVEYDFKIEKIGTDGQKRRIFCWLTNSGGGSLVQTLFFPQMVLTNTGRISNPADYLKPKSRGYEGIFSFYSQQPAYNTRYGTVSGRIYAETGNTDIEQAFTEYMTTEGMKFLD